MAKEIRIEEGKLKVIFEIRDNGVVELKQFDPAGRAEMTKELLQEVKRNQLSVQYIDTDPRAPLVKSN